MRRDVSYLSKEDFQLDMVWIQWVTWQIHFLTKYYVEYINYISKQQRHWWQQSTARDQYIFFTIISIHFRQISTKTLKSEFESRKNGNSLTNNGQSQRPTEKLSVDSQVFGRDMGPLA